MHIHQKIKGKMHHNYQIIMVKITNYHQKIKGKTSFLPLACMLLSNCLFV